MEWSAAKMIAKIRSFRSMREREEEMAAANPYLANALEKEKMEGHRFAVIARTIALTMIMVLLPFLNNNWHVLFYEVIVLAFIGLGWLQYRMASVGYSKTELKLILLDLVLLTLIFIIPNPFMDEEVPTAVLYRFDNFVYFYLILAVATLAYSWRTVWGIGLWVAILWMLGVVGVAIFGKEIPELDVAAREIFEGYDLVSEILTPSSLGVGLRVQEVVLFLIVAGILAIKGYRSNRLLMQQAEIAEERANLSRYFPATLVDTLASTDHDIGAVRSQEVAVLFTDIVGFTNYAESNPPEEVMELLRTYHGFVEKAIFENNGTLDKYIGDGVMATFGTPEKHPDDAINALKAAQQVLQEAGEYNARRTEQGLLIVEISVGVHYGPVILGDIGPARRLEFAVVGDTVNVASRLEAATRELDCHCVVSDDLIKTVEKSSCEDKTLIQAFEQKGNVTLKGRRKPISVWTS